MFSSLGGRVTSLDGGRATSKPADPPHAAYFDEIEVAHALPVTYAWRCRFPTRKQRPIASLRAGRC